MKFRQRTNYVLLALLSVLNIIIRFPITRHEIGVDSFFIHSMATSISTFGFAKWIIHPASFFGVYPYSYPSAHQFALSGVSQTTGITIEYVILILGMVLGIFSTFSFFILAKEIRDDDLFAFVVAFIFLFSPNFIRFTLWEAVTRSMFMAFFPIFLWLLLRFWKMNKKSTVSYSNLKDSKQFVFLFNLLSIVKEFVSMFFKFMYGLINNYTFLIIVFFILLAASHRLSFLLPLTLIALFVSIFFNFISSRVKRFKIFSKTDVLQVHVFYILLIISSILFLIQFLNVGPLDVSDYYSGYLYKGNDFVTVLLNMAIDYTGKTGPLIIFGIIGFISLLGKANKKFSELFVIFNFIIFLPFMGLENYSSAFFFPFLTITIGIGFMMILDFLKRNKMLMYTVLIASMLISVGFAFFMIDHWGMYEGDMSHATYNAAMFTRERANSTLVANTGALASQITAFSGKPVIPLSGPYAHSTTPGQLIYGFVKPEELVIRPLKLSEISPTVDTFYVATNAPNAKDEWVAIMQNNYWDERAKKMLSKYRAHLIIEAEYNKKYWYWVWRYSRMLTSLHDSGNKVYTNGKENIWYIG